MIITIKEDVRKDTIGRVGIYEGDSELPSFEVAFNSWCSENLAMGALKQHLGNLIARHDPDTHLITDSQLETIKTIADSLKETNTVSGIVGASLLNMVIDEVREGR